MNHQIIWSDGGLHGGLWGFSFIHFYWLIYSSHGGKILTWILFSCCRLLKQQMDGLITNFSEFLWIDFLGLHLLEKLFYAIWCGFYSQMKILNSMLVAFTYMVWYHFKFNLHAITVSVKTENINDSFNATCYTRWEEIVLCHDRLANWDNVNNHESGNGLFFYFFYFPCPPEVI